MRDTPMLGRLFGIDLRWFADRGKRHANRVRASRNRFQIRYGAESLSPQRRARKACRLLPVAALFFKKAHNLRRSETAARLSPPTRR